MNSFTDILLKFFPVPTYLDIVYPAVDISQSSIKCIIASRHGASVVPVTLEERSLVEGSIVNGNIQDLAHVAQELLVLAKKYSITSALVTLPEEHAYIFPVRTSSGSVEQMRTEVEFAMSEHVPIPFEHVVYTFEPVSDGVVGVVVYDARVSGEYERLLKMAGITPVSFVPHIVASARACSDPRREQAQYVVDIGRTRTSIALVYKNVTMGSATIYMGGKVFIEALVTRGHTPAEAEALLRSKGIGAEESLGVVWETFSSALLQYVILWREGVCNTDVTVPPPRTIVVCGGFSAVPGLTDSLSALTGMPVQQASVWRRLFSFDEYMPSLVNADSYRYASAAGLLTSNL